MKKAARGKIDVTIAPGLTSQIQSTPDAEWFHVSELDVSNVSLSLDGGEFVGTFKNDNGSGSLEHVRIKNNSANTCNIVIRYGTGNAPKLSNSTLIDTTFELDAATVTTLKDVSATITAGQVTDLKDVTVTPKPGGDVVLINEIVIGSSKVFADLQELTVMNSGTASGTVNTVEIEAGQVKTWRVYNVGQQMPDITADATNAGSKLHIVGVR